MAETRKFDPSSGDGLQKLVREALGETTRPVAPGQPQAADEQREQDTPGAEPSDAARVPDHLFLGSRDSGSSGGGGGGSW